MRRLVPGSNELQIEADGTLTNKGNPIGCGLQVNGQFLTLGDVTDGEYLKRSGSTIISGSPDGSDSQSQILAWMGL